jgi:hypothetical protein
MSSFSNKLWTDEACFKREGVFNVHNDHFWARNKSWYFGVNVWAGFVGNIVLGPYLLPDRPTAQRCREFLETVLPGLLEDVPLAVRQRLWF